MLPFTDSSRVIELRSVEVTRTCKSWKCTVFNIQSASAEYVRKEGCLLQSSVIFQVIGGLWRLR